MAARSPSADPGLRADHAVAALVDPAGCGGPRLRAAAEALGGRGVVSIGSVVDAERAAAAGLRVVGCCAPPLGRVGLARRAILAAVGGPRPYGTLAAVGPRAEEALRATGIRRDGLRMQLPRPLAAAPREEVREAWGVAPGDTVCLLVGAPPHAADARLALDVVGRAACLGGPVVLVAHPDAAGVAHARRFTDAAGSGWRLIVDPRCDEPETLAPAADVAIAVAAPLHPDADPFGPAIALRAGIPMVAAEGAPGAEAVRDGRRFDRRRPNVAARMIREAAAQGRAGACAATSAAAAPR